jgi:hypothetical protein
MLSDKIGQKDWNRIGVTTALRIRKVPVETRKFIAYHNEYIYGLAPD